MKEQVKKAKNEGERKRALANRMRETKKREKERESEERNLTIDSLQKIFRQFECGGKLLLFSPRLRAALVDPHTHTHHPLSLTHSLANPPSRWINRC